MHRAIHSLFHLFQHVPTLLGTSRGPPATQRCCSVIARNDLLRRLQCFSGLSTSWWIWWERKKIKEGPSFGIWWIWIWGIYYDGRVLVWKTLFRNRDAVTPGFQKQMEQGAWSPSMQCRVINVMLWICLCHFVRVQVHVHMGLRLLQSWSMWWPMQNAKLCKIIELHSLYLLVKTCKPQRESQCDDQRFQSKVIWRFRRLPESARVCCRISRSYRLNETAAQQSPCKYTRIRILMCPHCLMTQHPRSYLLEWHCFPI